MQNFTMKALYICSYFFFMYKQSLSLEPKK
jgi:hypothetical protein